jgi:hypothetical protein
MDMPYGVAELRPVSSVSQCTVTCHVTGCTTTVARQEKHFRAREEFLCPAHRIYLSPTTFQHQCPHRNLLWRDDEDRRLLDAIRPVKRTMARLGRERDEDALTWNVVRAFEREGKVGRLVGVLLGGELTLALREQEPRVIYWGADGPAGLWDHLARARCEFGEDLYHGSEPDVAFWWPDGCLVVVEAKLCASNETRPSPKPPGEDPRPAKYQRNGHFGRVFTASYCEIAHVARKYELMRLWLLGSWIAQQHKAAFHLVNLVRWQAETDIEDRFGSGFCRQRPERCFRRATWESVWDALPATGLSDQTASALDHYFSNKSCGYGSDGRLQPAFTPRTEREGGL